MIVFWIAAVASLEPSAPPATAERPDPAVESKWYGGPAVATDAISSALIVWGLAAPDGTPIIPGAAGFALGAPINHLAHGNPGRAALSLGARLLAGALVTPVLREHVLTCDAPPCRDPDRPLTLVALLAAGVMVADDLLLARAPVSKSEPPPASALLSPGMVAAPGLALLSLSGRF